MAQLVEGAARDHAADHREAHIGSDTPGIFGYSQPNAPVTLDFPSKRAVIDQFVPDASYASYSSQSGWAHQNVSAGCRRGFVLLAVDPPGRIEHKKKENERGNEGTFRERFTAQRDHHRDEIVIARLRQ